ncbi:type-1 angiotensin II receptor-associated protein isoform X2 [Phascolarctos cinereus]|uniref:Type-1 angiotensin II receptor-associated protein isoform X2 n=1 Tax=Phascolarctos cinereus TaxID=38626 RepID=A0A6P5J560_PHACI|nr:type-1 angiotensin II receptor-associated protein isoform X2 [Phascolarctos cinereus]
MKGGPRRGLGSAVSEVHPSLRTSPPNAEAGGGAAVQLGSRGPAGGGGGVAWCKLTPSPSNQPRLAVTCTNPGSGGRRSRSWSRSWGEGGARGGAGKVCFPTLRVASEPLQPSRPPPASPLSEPALAPAPAWPGMELPAVNLKFFRLTDLCVSRSSPSFCPFALVGHRSGALAADNMFLVGLAITILLDIIYISIFYPHGIPLSDTIRFSTGMAIFSLLLKPLSCLFVYHMYRERGGEFILNIGSLGPLQERSAYQTIDTQEDPALAHPYADLESKPAARPY